MSYSLEHYPGEGAPVSTSERTFSSIRNFILGNRQQGSIFFGFYQLRCKEKSQIGHYKDVYIPPLG